MFGKVAPSRWNRIEIPEKELEETEILDYERYLEMEIPVIEINGELYIGFLEISQLNLSLPVMAEEWDLTLFTCTYGGNERYTLRCVRNNQ